MHIYVHRTSKLGNRDHLFFDRSISGSILRGDRGVELCKVVTNGMFLLLVFRNDMLIIICMSIIADLFLEEVYCRCDGICDMGLDVLVHFGYVASNLYDAEQLCVHLTFEFSAVLSSPDMVVNHVQEPDYVKLMVLIWGVRRAHSLDVV